MKYLKGSLSLALCCLVMAGCRIERKQEPLVVVEQREVADNPAQNVSQSPVAAVAPTQPKQVITPVNEVYKPQQATPQPGTALVTPPQPVVAVKPEQTDPPTNIVKQPVVKQPESEQSLAVSETDEAEISQPTPANEEELSKLEVALSCEMSEQEEEKTDQEILLGIMRASLERHFAVYDLDEVNRRAEAEARTNGITPIEDAQAYRNFKLQKQPLTLSVQVRTSLQGEGWYATVGCRALRPQLGEEILVKSLSTGERDIAPTPVGDMPAREARSLAIGGVTQMLAEEVITRLKEWHKANKNVYRIKFIGFSRADRDKIENVVDGLSAGVRPQIKLLQDGNMIAGEYLEIRCKWMRQPSLPKIIQTLQEYCSVHEVMLHCTMSCSGLIVFEPKHNYRPTPSPNSDIAMVQPQPAEPEALVTISKPEASAPPAQVEARDWKQAAVTVTAEGRGFTQKGAIATAWLAALRRCVRENVPASLFDHEQENIQAYLVSNWHKYVVGDRHRPRIVRPYNEDTRNITIEIQINAGLLLQDIERRFVQPQQKIQSTVLALLPMLGNDLAIEGEWLDRDAMFDTVYDALKPHMQLHNLKTIKDMMMKERSSLGLSQDATPADYVKAKLGGARFIVYLSVTTTQRTDPATQNQVWEAVISCRALDLASGNEAWRFEVSSGRDAKPVIANIGLREARSQAIQNVARKVAQKILDEIKKI